MQLASAWALLAVEQLARVLTLGAADPAPICSAGFRGEEAAGSTGYRRGTVNPGLQKKRSRPGCWTHRLATPFSTIAGQYPHAPRPPPVIMLLIDYRQAGHPTAQASPTAAPCPRRWRAAARQG